jgi:glutathione S-transferase
VSTRLSTPTLLLDDGEVIADSGDILRWADRQGVWDPDRALYPDQHRDEILEFESQLHDRLGGHTRRIAYANGLLDSSVMRATARHNVGAVQAGLFAALAPLVGAMMRRALKISPEQGERSRRAIAPELERLSAFVADREYCFGGHFSAADLTLACMLAPVVRPPGYGAWLPPLDAFSDEVQSYVDGVRATPVGTHVLRMFRDHRAAAA